MLFYSFSTNMLKHSKFPFLTQVKILGGQDIHVKEGSAVVLKCVITNIVEKPPFVTWYLNNKVGGAQHKLREAGLVK